MRTSELRIGNLVQYPGWHGRYPGIFRIRDLYTDDNRVGLTNGRIQVPSSKLNRIIGIPITEEWLSKFGFEKIEEDKIWVLSITPDFSFMLTFTYEDDFSIAISDVPNSPNSICPSGNLFKYVHQFQNLYFILTGTELEIKE